MNELGRSSSSATKQRPGPEWPSTASTSGPSESGRGWIRRLALRWNALDRRPLPEWRVRRGERGPPALSPASSPAGIYTNALSERLNGALRSPLVPKDKKFVSVQIMGGKLGAWRTVLDNCMLSEDYQTLDHDSLQWLKITNRTDQPTLPFYLELVTKTDNPRIPDRPGRLKATQQQIDSPYSYFGIARAVVHDVDETPKDELSHMQRLFAGASSESPEARAARYEAAVTDAIERWRGRSGHRRRCPLAPVAAGKPPDY